MERQKFRNRNFKICCSIENGSHLVVFKFVSVLVISLTLVFIRAFLDGLKESFRALAKISYCPSKQVRPFFLFLPIQILAINPLTSYLPWPVHDFFPWA